MQHQDRTALHGLLLNRTSPSRAWVPTAVSRTSYHSPMQHEITEGVYSNRAVARRSPEWQAAHSLAEGAQAFRVWRDQRTRGRKRPLYLKFHRFEFRGLNLAGAELSGLRLTSTIFENCDLRGARLRGANLNGAEFRNCAVTGVDFEQAKLVGTDLTGHDLTGVNFYGSVRDGWRIGDVQCRFAWVHEARGTGADPTPFRESEFEFAFGGRRVVLSFPDGGEAIDLLALPFHFKRLQEVYPAARLSLVGLRFTPAAAMEIRLDSDTDGLPIGMEATFKGQVPQTRRDVEETFETLVTLRRQAEAQLRMLDRQQGTIDALQSTIERLVGMLEVAQRPIGVLVQPGATYVAADSASISTQVGDQYFGLSPGDLPAVLFELERLRARVAPTSDSDLLKAVDDLSQAIQRRDETTGRKVVQNAGKRLFDAAEQVGTSVLTALLERMLGLG